MDSHVVAMGTLKRGTWLGINADTRTLKREFTPLAIQRGESEANTVVRRTLFERENPQPGRFSAKACFLLRKTTS